MTEIENNKEYEKEIADSKKEMIFMVKFGCFLSLVSILFVLIYSIIRGIL